jgi:uncharacterized protein with FMN-binding domain
MTSGLVALSSAAILAIYSAGYLRTRSASDRVALAAERRPPLLASLSENGAAPAASEIHPAGRPSIDTASQAAIGVDAPASVEPRGAPVTAVEVLGRTAARGSAKDETGPASTGTASARSRPASTSVPTAAPTAAVAPSAIGAAPAATPLAGVPAEPAATTAAANVPSNGSATGEVTAAETPLPATATAKPRFKDGTYSGWGSCRHGDLEATVVITGGRIVSATISQCLTRYPCHTWLAPLPAQVVLRQGPGVDYVSGATDSTDAFYGAVYDALFKAR